MSGLDISERRLPQDGRFNVKVRDQHVDVRISSMPTQHGEAIVMRLLHRAGGLHQLSDLGMSPDVLQRFASAIHRYTGMVLVTGPTGSGKTTTLYAALNELNTPDCKIITVEDPVEYRLDGLNQVQVNEKIELDFSRVLRSARRDPAAGRILAGSGCQHCNSSGYAGRVGIYEMLEMDNELAALANSDDPGRFIAAAEQRMAGRLLRDSAVELAMTGKTTISEAMRVTAQLED